MAKLSTSFLALVFLSLSLASSSSFAQETIHAGTLDDFDPAKRTVCTVTINSSDEQQVFKDHLNAHNSNKFQFVELTGGKESKDWFEKACHSNIKCDVLIISGHFAGEFFFGESGNSLDVQALESHSCQRDCPGILSNPKEVFLFGCNSLATKTHDSRTPQEYLQVLIDDGVERKDAERMVEGRYGPVGDSNQARIRSAFAGIPHIYGFSSIAPLGQQIEPHLEQYLSTKGDYDQYLKQEEVRSISRTLEKLQTFTEKNDPSNIALGLAMRGTSFRECPGLAPDDPAYELKRQTCVLYDPKATLTEKLEAVIRLMRSPDRLGAFPAIERFFAVTPMNSLTPEQADAFKTLSGLTTAKTETLSEITETKSLGLKADLIVIAHAVGWMSDAESDAQLRTPAIKLLTPPVSVGASDDLCGISNDSSQFLNLHWSDLPTGALQDANGLKALKCLHLQDSAIYLHAVDVLNQNNAQAAETASTLFDGQSDPQVIKKLLEVAENPGASGKTYAATALVSVNPTDDESWDRIASDIQKGFLNPAENAFILQHPRVPSVISRVAKDLTNPDASVREASAKLLWHAGESADGPGVEFALLSCATGNLDINMICSAALGDKNRGSKRLDLSGSLLAALPKVSTMGRIYILEAVSRIGYSDAQVETSLSTSLNDSDPQVRNATIRAFHNLGYSPSVESLLLDRLKDSNTLVKKQALFALLDADDTSPQTISQLSAAFSEPGMRDAIYEMGTPTGAAYQAVQRFKRTNYTNR